MDFDIVFIDAVSPYPYDDKSPDVIGMGGTEKTVVAIAEGLSHIGFKVAVFEACLQKAIKGRAFYLPLSSMSEHTAKVCVSLRGVVGFSEFKNAKKIAWLHDMPSPKLYDHMNVYLKENVTVLAVSKYHKYRILDYINKDSKISNLKIKYIYNPVLPVGAGMSKNNKTKKNNMIWASSPHKGLTNALEMFSVVKKHIPELTLSVFNPGYIKDENVGAIKDVTFFGSVPSHVVWELMGDSFCVFYPSTFLETFGLVFAEANAVGCPVLAYECGALPEILKPSSQFVKPGIKEVVERLKTWYFGGAPEVKGNPKFALNTVLNEWLKLLSNI